MQKILGTWSHTVFSTLQPVKVTMTMKGNVGEISAEPKGSIQKRGAELRRRKWQNNLWIR